MAERFEFSEELAEAILDAVAGGTSIMTILHWGSPAVTYLETEPTLTPQSKAFRRLVRFRQNVGRGMDR
jgi:hypothetical protein